MSSSADLLALLRRLQVIDADTPVDAAAGDSADRAGATWVSRGLLTRFQLDAILRGKGDRLRVGPYLLLDRLGRGGMGEVFRARHVRLGREVALKLIRQDKLESDAIAARFLRELRGAARVEHPSVVRVYNAGRDARHFYFSMEHVRGASLAELVKRGGPMPVADACRAAGDVALGLQAVHAAGLVHRDLKPANLMREDATGRTKILDLGLAGLTVRHLNDSAALTLTQAGVVLGTPDYMSPEQALDPHGVDHRGDLYALGCTLAYLLTGRPVFPDGTPVEKLFQHAYVTPPDVRAARPDVPPGLADLIARLLAKAPADRPTVAAVAQTVGAFAEFTAPVEAAPSFAPAEDDLVFDTPDDEPPPPRRPRRWLPVGVAAGVVVALAAAITWGIMWGGKPADPPAVSAEPPTPEARAVALHEAMGKPGADAARLRAELFALFAEHRHGPGGAGVARVLRRTSSPLDDLPVLNAGRGENGGKPALVARWDAAGPRHVGPAFAVAVSPDGRTVATVGRDRLVRVWRADTGEPLRTLAGFTDPVYSVTFSPDGRRVAATSHLQSPNDTEGFERKARVWDVATGELLLTAGGTLDWVVSWRFSPTGDTALAGRYDELKVRSARDGKVLKAFAGKTHGTNWVLHADFSRDGRFAVAACNDFHLRVWDVETGDEVRAWKASNRYCGGFDRSPADDAVLVVADEVVRVWDWTAGTKLTEHRPDAAPVTAAAFTPDGKQLVVGGGDGRVGLFDRTSGKAGDRVSGHDGAVSGVAVAADGRRAFTVGQDGTLRRWDVRGEQLVELDPPPTVRPAAALAFLNEDRALVVARPGQPPQVWNLADSPPPPTPPPAEAGPVAVSPDGRRVVNCSGDTIRVWSMQDGTSNDFVTGVGAPAAVAWFPDGRRLVVAPRDTRHEMAVFDAASGKVVSRLAAGAEVDGPVAVSPDGRWLAAGLRDGGVGWWDLGSGRPAAVVPPPSGGRPLALGFHPTRPHLRVVGPGWQVTELSPGSPKPGRMVWDSDSATPHAATDAPDGTTAILSAKTGDVRLLSESSRVPRVWSFPDRSTALAVSASGRYLALAHADGGVRLYRLPQQ